jgi:lipooligosaccharide transport system ATP-binding protein
MPVKKKSTKSAKTSVPLIKATNLHKKYGELTAVNDVSFEIAEGTCTGLLGPNGAGKTTTMKMLLGLAQVTGGKLEVFGESVTTLPRHLKQRIGLVSQENNLDMDLTIRENLVVYGSYYGLAKQTARERADLLLKYMQIESKADNKVQQLSGGMKRRLTIARALIADPELVVLDEPTTGLDPQVRVMIWQRILELKKQGKTLLLTTHYMDEAQRLCDQIIVIDHGEILDEGTPRELIERHVPAHVFDIPKPVPEKILSSKMRQEDIGESVLVYTDDPCAVRDHMPDDAPYLHRPADLEDVFLGLTGRKLREGA